MTEDVKGQKVLIFSYYKDTARYLYRHLGDPDSPDAVKFLKQAGDIIVRRMDGGNRPDERVKIVEAFAPKANGKPEWVSSEREIDVLISKDVLSEGQDLQDYGYLLNYDLHWNPHAWCSARDVSIASAPISRFSGFTICFPIAESTGCLASWIVFPAR